MSGVLKAVDGDKILNDYQEMKHEGYDRLAEESFLERQLKGKVMLDKASLKALFETPELVLVVL